MKRTLSLLAAGALAVGGMTALATPAMAEPSASKTLTASGCDEVDYQVTVGTTVVLTYEGACDLLAPYAVGEGAPTIAHVAKVRGYGLVWHQAVGRASADATCDAGWSPSWAQWMNDGAGGYTCERVIDWGDFAGRVGTVSITVTTSTDFASSTDEQSYVFGCGDDPGYYDWPVIGNCS